MTGFANPGNAGSGDRFSVKDNDGRLVVVTPSSIQSDIQTSFGAKDAVIADVVLLDGPNAGEEAQGAYLFGKALIGQLRSKFGERVLGRIAKGTAKPGQAAPWVLTDPTPDDLKAAEAWAVKADANPY